MLDMPYFMQNEEWYYFDFDKKKYMLTDKAPKEAVESWKQHQKDLELEEKGNAGQK